MGTEMAIFFGKTGFLTEKQAKSLFLQYTAFPAPKDCKPSQARSWGDWNKSKRHADKIGARVEMEISLHRVAHSSIKQLAHEFQDKALGCEDRIERHRPHLLVELMSRPKFFGKPRCIAKTRVLLLDFLEPEEDRRIISTHQLHLGKFMIDLEIERDVTA
jgi:hypothetical protein